MNLGLILSQTRRHSRQASQSGQALIETAITLSMLMIMLIGVAELGRVAWATIQVTNAAKAAVQYGDQSGNTSVDYTGMETAAANASPYLPTLKTTPSGPVCTCANDGSSVACTSTTACPGSTVIKTITVKTSDTFDPLIHLPGLPNKYTLTAQAVQQVLSVNN